MELDDFNNTTPVITLEVLTESSSNTNPSMIKQYLNSKPALLLDSGVHFLTDIEASSLLSSQVEPSPKESVKSSVLPVRTKDELLEYLIKSDGSVVCKRCGEVLQSRTHWYRHKYKFHVVPPPNPNPSPLFKCEQCGVFFKSRKGYIGHIASRHSENCDNESNNLPTVLQTTIKQEPLDAELSIPSCELPNVNYIGPKKKEKNQLSGVSVIKIEPRKGVRVTKGSEPSDESHNPNWEKQQRLQEERLVADIIARVRKECEEAGASSGARKGYSRKSALANI